MEDSMSSRLLLLSALLSALFACKPPPEAPTELGDLSIYLFANFDDPDPLVMQAGVVNMLAFIEEFEASADLSVESSATDRSWTIFPLEESDWGGAPHVEGVDPLSLDSVSVAVRSSFAGSDHSPLIGVADQMPFESSSSARYDRTFLDDFDSWHAAQEGALRTSNEIDRDNILLTLTYDCSKDYRWVAMPDGSVATVGRSWISESFINEPGAGGVGEDVLDFFSNLEMTIPSGDTSVRYNAVWGHVGFVPAVDQTVLLNTVRNGIQEGMAKTEAYLTDAAGAAGD
jgi:hypothetical protein